ncbi:Amicyanin-alpha [Streptomyces sp. MBT84]|uniref:cupredoxin domain-containing protein n=1 Tax=unclassified Streptomyces TaxID=2593676 RepID=UPI001D4E402E|nr:plastocyanin/azurin family copper-binding protein [Streptomyces sp. MBT84]MBW8698278.1 Amicyanin-alpha [Streptomyces sp. MBT84]
MHLNFRPSRRRTRVAAGLAVAALGTLGLLSACGQSPHPSSRAGDITPGPGQSQTAGMPGDGKTGNKAGSASSVPAMPHMSMPPSSPDTKAPATGDAVAIKNFTFSPAKLRVKAGTTVTWTNQDTDPHTVTSAGSGGPLHSAALTTHATYSYTFTKPGTYAYLCTIHPFMTATVEVT